MLQVLTYNIYNASGEYCFTATYEEIIDTAQAKKLPYGEYTLVAPYVGQAKRVIGCIRAPAEYKPMLIEAIELCLMLGSSEKIAISERQAAENKIKASIQIYEIAEAIIYQLHTNLVRCKMSISDYTSVFRFLDKNGAVWKDLPHREHSSAEARDNFRKAFVSLTKNVFGTEHLSTCLADVGLGDPENATDKTAYGNYAREVDFFLNLGADLNGVCSDFPEHGTLLHQYLAYEMYRSTDFFNFLRSKAPVVPFNYAAQDAEQKTPLVIALYTRNTQAVSTLVSLAYRGGDVGLNIPDVWGRTPLMLACAFGLLPVVKLLLTLGADPALQDTQGRAFPDYAELPEKELKTVLGTMVHPDRAVGLDHSYLYAPDRSRNPYCLFDKEIVTGADQQKHFIVLSPLQEHQERLVKVLNILSLKHGRLNRGKDHQATHRALAELNYVKAQIKLTQGKETFYSECKKGQASVRAYIQSDEGQSCIKKLLEQNREKVSEKKSVLSI